MVDSTVYFDVRLVPAGSRVAEADVKALATQFHSLMRGRSIAVGELYGSSTDLWGFSFDFDGYQILFSVSPNQISKSQQWFADVLLDEPGWFSATRATRLAAMKRVERAVHDALIHDLKAQNIEWFVGKGRTDRRQSQPEP
jgi:hypothetical protein